MIIKRSVEEKIKSLGKFFPSVIITGARQSGKTTLAHKVFPKHNYVSLDLPSLADQAENSAERFFADHQAPVVVDEIQYAPGLFRHVKRLIDEDREGKGRFILTGSQKFVLMKFVSDSLAGRTAIINLENLSFSDLRKAGLVGDERKDIIRVMTRGQFPELWKDDHIPQREYFHSYLSTYLERDVRQILNVTNLRDFERFIRVLASRNGALLNKTEIAKDVGVSSKAIGDWLSVLEASGQISFLEPWFANFGKRIVKTPKVYFNDTGLLCFLLGVSESNGERSPFIGSLWEAFVFAELRKLIEVSDQPRKLWYYRDKLGREIDFLVESGGTLHLGECKWTESPKSDDARWVYTVRDEIGRQGGPWRPGKAYIVCPSGPRRVIKGGAELLPMSGIGELTETAGA